MSNDELKIIIKILESKETKSNAIFYQKYSEAADARDRERVYESKLINFLGYKKGDFPVTDEHAKKIITFPCDQHLSLKEMKYVISVVRNFYN